jgi:hypothetical protein
MSMKLKWCPYALHSPIGHRCMFRLGTIVNDRVIVSTIGQWVPRNEPDGQYETISGVPGELFETMVFQLDGYDEHGNPIKGDELHCRRYVDSKAADKGHHDYLEIYANV